MEVALEILRNYGTEGVLAATLFLIVGLAWKLNSKLGNIKDNHMHELNDSMRELVSLTKETNRMLEKQSDQLIRIEVNTVKK